MMYSNFCQYVEKVVTVNGCAFPRMAMVDCKIEQ